MDGHGGNRHYSGGSYHMLRTPLSQHPIPAPFALLGAGKTGALRMKSVARGPTAEPGTHPEVHCAWG